ncbi:MAG: D-alanine-D-alanine ligase [Parcubacteria group bacterium Gr01-1014_3]|nr:MAG: D-alanine-D-alanine ligase [Parcubacteria group bacterium Gr01-1014_3]
MENKRIRVVVLMGGPSAEHDISLATGEKVLESLDKEKYSAKAVVISKKGKWPVTLAKVKANFDVAFVAMHGEYGEDGQIQKILEKAQIPYTGSDSRASGIGIDKAESAKFFEKAGLRTPKFTLMTIKDPKKISLEQIRFIFPMVVKPADRGSSVGISIVKKVQDLLPALQKAAKFSKKIMLQEYVKGREFTCGVAEINGEIQALPPTEIITYHSDFFDYEAKYTPGVTREITPPEIPSVEIEKIQEIAIKAHRAIGARHFSRTDVIQDKDKNYYVLEINTIPGMTATSLLPQQAKAAGINFSELLGNIVDSVLSKS